jgi:hypothetical protein
MSLHYPKNVMFCLAAVTVFLFNFYEQRGMKIQILCMLRLLLFFALLLYL